MKYLQYALNQLNEIDINELSEKLISTANAIAKRRDENLMKKKQELQKSLDQLQQLKIDDMPMFNTQNSLLCLQRVCDDIYFNAFEQIEIQNSLNELASIMYEEQQQINQFPQAKNLQLLTELQSNKVIKERLEGALKINLSHKEILKEILMKIGQENQNQKIEYEIEIKTLQLNLIDLAQANQDFNKRIIELESTLTEKHTQLLKLTSQFQQIESQQSRGKQQSQQDLVECYEIKNVVSQKISQQDQINQSQQSEQFYSIIDNSQNAMEINNSQQSSCRIMRVIEPANSNILNQSYSLQQGRSEIKKITLSFDYGNPLESQNSFIDDDFKENQFHIF